MLKAVIFDFDGVILESVDIKTRAFGELFAGHPEHLDKILDLHIRNGGMSRFEKFNIIYRDFLKQPLDQPAAQRLADRFSEIVYREILSCPFVPGAREFLDFCLPRYSLFIASGTPDEEIRDIVEKRNLSSFFRAVHGSPTTKQDILLSILRLCNLSPNEALFIGDALGDYRAARDVSVPFIGRITSDAPNPFPAEVLGVVESLSELRGLWESKVAQLC